MSVSPTPTFKQRDTTTTGMSPAQVVANYALPVLIVIGVFVLIAMGKLDSATGIPLIAVIGGVHGGAAVTNAATKS